MVNQAETEPSSGAGQQTTATPAAKTATEKDFSSLEVLLPQVHLHQLRNFLQRSQVRMVLFLQM